MPAVIAAIAAVVSGVASAVGAVVGFIAGMVGTIIAPFIAAITAVVGGITGVLGPIVGKLLGPLNSVVDALMGPLAGKISIMGKQILGPVIAMQAAISTGILEIEGAITKKIVPVLEPVADTLRTVREFVGGVKTIIVDDLEPITEIADIIRSISTVKLSNILLAGTGDVVAAISPMIGRHNRTVLGGITTVWRETTEAITGLATITDDYYKLLKGEIDSVGDRLTAERETALAALEGQIDTTIVSLQEGFTLRLDPVKTQIATVTTKLEDLPRFQRMMIRALA